MGRIIIADALDGLRTLPDESIDMCVTSPPYYNLRDYGMDGQIGMERTPDEYICRLVAVFREVKRVLKPTGTLWIVIADSYAGSGKGRDKDGCWKSTGGKQGTNTGSCIGVLKKTGTVGCKPKDLIGIPWSLAFALRDDGWYLRSDIIWDKSGNVFPESVKDRCTKAHFAAYPPELIRPCILAGCEKGGTVLDPFMGSGTTAYVAKQEDCDFIGIEIQPEYEALIYERLAEL